MPPRTKSTIIVVFLVFTRFQNSLGLTIDPSGGYHVTLGIHNSEPKPASITEYVKHIAETFQDFSGQLWRATKENFYIAKLDITLPSSWNFTTERNTTQSYVTADIRVSSNHAKPYVQNSNLCGLSGDYIELPKSFFDDPKSGLLGENWKVLLVHWARYRWGVYEEHGIPGDKTFPYFMRDFDATETTPKWIPNGCSNAIENKLVGEYRNLDDSTCDPYTEEELEVQCRFYPDTKANENVTSSLMYFHFMDSVSEFCDASTHQRHVPTKQNLYCDNKSVMETIESSPDFKAVTNKTIVMPDITISVYSVTSKKALYLLFDNSIADARHEEFIDGVNFQLLTYFLNKRDPGIELVIGAGHLPSEDGGPFLRQLVPLGFLYNNFKTILPAIINRPLNTNHYSDFGIGLLQTIGAIRATSPSEDGDILFVKTNGAKNTSIFIPEKELELALRRENIRLFPIEIVGPNRAGENLRDLSTATGGQSLALELDNMEALEQIPGFLDQILPKEGVEQATRLERISFSQTISPNRTFTIQVLEGSQLITFILSTPGKLNKDVDIKAGIFNDDIQYPVVFVEQMDYRENRHVYSGLLNDTLKIMQVKFNYTGIDHGYLTVLSDSHGNNLPQDVSVQVRTSAINHMVDFGNLPNPQAPFVITATVTQNNLRISGANVTAKLQMGQNTIKLIPLSDSPMGLDNPPGDGVYSEILLFPQDGLYSVTVTVTNNNNNYFDGLSTFTSPSLLLIPPDQKFEEVETVPMPPGAMINIPLEFDIQVINTDKFVPSIQKIRDVSSSRNSFKPEEVTVTFRAPRIFNLTIEAAPTSYCLYVAENPDLLINLNSSELPEGVEEALCGERDLAPGDLVTFTYTTNQTYTIYAVVISLDEGVSSVSSNIMRIEPMHIYETTTTTIITESTTDLDDTTDMSESEPTTDLDDTTDPTESEPTTDLGDTENPSEPETTTDPAEPVSSTYTSDGTTDEFNTTEDPDGSTTSELPIQTTTTGNPDGSTSTEHPGEGTPWAKSAGGIATIIIIVLVCIAAIGAGYWYLNKRRHGSRGGLFGSSQA